MNRALKLCWEIDSVRYAFPSSKHIKSIELKAEPTIVTYLQRLLKLLLVGTKQGSGNFLYYWAKSSHIR